MLMDKLTVSGVEFSKIVAISGTAQVSLYRILKKGFNLIFFLKQHGSVYWQNGAENLLKNLDSSQFLHHQLCTSFSIPNSPIWMDSSTSKQCKELEDAVNGPEVRFNKCVFCFW